MPTPRFEKFTHRLRDLGTKLRYHFDNGVTRGPFWFVVTLGVMGLITSVVITLLGWIVGAFGDSSTSSVLTTGLWQRIDSILLGNEVPPGTPAVRLVWALQWIPTITISAAIIAFVTTTMNRRLEALSRGASPVIETGHTLVLGWSTRIFPILDQLVIASEGRRRTIVIIADRKTTLMMTEIEARCDDLGKLRVVCRTGDPTNPKAHVRANLKAASGVIVLEPDSGDTAAIATVLAVKSLDPELQIPVVVEVSNPHHATALRHATGEKVRTVSSWNIIARVTAQASRQPGIAQVFTDFLDFAGNEIHIISIPALWGHSYGEALVAFEDAKLIGLERGDIPMVNPASNTVIEPGDFAIVISETSTVGAVKFGYQSTREPLRTDEWLEAPEHLLIIGWSEMSEAVLTELAPFVEPDSTVSVLADAALIKQHPLPNYGNIMVDFVDTKGSTRALESALRERAFDQVLVMAYRHQIDTASADAKTMLILLLINTVLKGKGRGVRLIAEILDSRRADLALITEPDDLVVSDRLAAQMISQLIEDARLLPIFNDLFDAKGSTLNLHPIELYVPHGDTLTVRELTAIAARRRESLVGIRHGDGTIVLNPPASSSIAADPRLSVIVVS